MFDDTSEGEIDKASWNGNAGVEQEEVGNQIRQGDGKHGTQGNTNADGDEHDGGRRSAPP